MIEGILDYAKHIHYATEEYWWYKAGLFLMSRMNASRQRDKEHQGNEFVALTFTKESTTRIGDIEREEAIRLGISGSGARDRFM